MNRLNAKRIGVLAASLLFGLAVAGPVSFSNIPIINSAGQPVVQVVVGSQAQPSDGVVAANIAAVIGNLAFTTTPVTATVAGKGGLSCVVTTATCTVSGQQVYLGESGTSTPAGSYGFTALIGSVLNRGITLGSPISTKTLQSSASGYASQPDSTLYTTTNSPPDSPYIGTSVPTAMSATSSYNGGGMAFNGFSNTLGGDNLMVIGNSQFPTLMSNAGAHGESEYLFLTGFPVYDQQTSSPSVKNFAVLNAGGAYEVLFNNPIHEPWYHSSSTGLSGGGTGGTNTINNAEISLLGQNWTIVSATLPGSTSGISSTVATTGGKIGLAASLVPLSTVYVGKNLTSGPFTVQLADLGQAGTTGVSPAAINVYYNGVLTNSSSVYPGNTVKYNVSGSNLYVKVNQTFAGLYAYQKWAKIQMYSGVYNISGSGGVFNQTTNPGWNVYLLWTNKTSTSDPTDLSGIILYNSTPTMLTSGQSFTFIQDPKAYKVTLAGDTLGNNYDHVTVTSQYAGSVNYANSPTGTGKGLGNINNINETAQELVVTSTIPNAFTTGGFTGSSVTYDLTPYVLTEDANGISVGSTANAAVNVVLSLASSSVPFVTSTYQLIATIKGYGNTGSPTTATATFSGAGTQATGTQFYNVTSITLNRALPGVTVSADSGVASSANTLAELTTTGQPQVMYTVTGQNYQSLTSGASVTYNQQNGQPTTAFTLSTATPASFGTQNSFFQYSMNEINVPSQSSSQDQFTFNIVNSTAGVGATTLFYLNYSASAAHNNVTYTSSQGNSVLAPQGFISERGSKVASLGPTNLAFDMAENVDSLQFVVGTVNSTVSSSSGKTVGPYSIGQSTNLPNVTIANITAKCTVTGAGSGCTVSGMGNLTGVPTVQNATTPVKLNTATQPLVVLDSNANSASTLIVVGSKYVNSVAQQIFSQNPSLDSSFGPGSVVAQAFGSNRILVAGYYANQTVQAGNQFIQALLSSAGS
ncbi:MAG: S-layer protein [Candidatus Marsarchaeota archaeon]|nr:S-layer protein [Candidatus Marsarchaeota archaeon]